MAGNRAIGFVCRIAIWRWHGWIHSKRFSKPRWSRKFIRIIDYGSLPCPLISSQSLSFNQVSLPFSIPIKGIKLTNEPPKSIKQNMLQIFSSIKETEYNSCKQKIPFQKLVFSLSLFHSVIIERKNFGPIGWNVSYDWMASDFDTSLLQLKVNLFSSRCIWNSRRKLVLRISIHWSQRLIMVGGSQMLLTWN